MASSVFIGYFGGGAPWSWNGTTATLTGSLSVSGTITSGSNAAQTGQLRIPNNTGLYGRDGANTGDILMIGVTSLNTLRFGQHIEPSTDAATDIGATTQQWRDLYLSRNVMLGAKLAFSATAPTISSGFGTSPSIVAGTAAAFTLNVGTGGTATGGVIGLPTATTGWILSVKNLTALAANRANQTCVQTASTTTSATIQNQTISTGAALAFTASDILQITAVAY